MRHLSPASVVLAFALLAGCTHYQGPTDMDPEPQPKAEAAFTTTQPAQTGLPQAVEDWVGLLEKDGLADASKRWAKDADAAKRLAQWWESLKRCHQQYDYRNWVRQAEQIGDATAFTVGGHSYGFTHTDWERTSEGWRIVRVWICR